MYKRSNYRGSVVITVLLTLMIIIGAVFVYYYYTRLSALGPPIPSFISSTPIPLSETSDWTQFNDSNLGLSLKVPPNWYISENKRFISQFPYNENKNSTTDIYNVFYIIKNENQLQSGYTNDDWLSKIDRLKPNERLTNEYRPASSLSIAKISSGKTAEGKKFVVFKNTIIDEGVIGAFKSDEVVYEFILRFYDQNGIDYLQKILSTVKVTAPAPTP